MKSSKSSLPRPRPLEVVCCGVGTVSVDPDPERIDGSVKLLGLIIDE